MGESCKMFCPICKSTTTEDKPQTPNGGDLFVAEEINDAVEGYDFDIIAYTCDLSEEHKFYISTRKIESMSRVIRRMKKNSLCEKGDTGTP